MKPKSETNATSSSDLPGFESVDLENINEKTLTSDDLESRKKQLWLIKVPYEFDVSKLSGTTVVLNGSQDLSVKADEQQSVKRYETRASKYKKGESCHFKMVVPSKTGDSLDAAKDFSGHMEIIQTVKVPMLVYPPTPPPMYTDIPKGLKPRWKPFGHKTPPKINKREEIVKEEVSLEVGKKRSRNEEKTELRKSPKKKKKKKTNESGYASALNLDDSSSSAKKKRKKNKRNS